MAKSLYTSPFFRVLTQLSGRPSSADKATFTALMKKNCDLALIPGGFEEATLHTTQVDRVYLKDRQGFVKYALQYGYALVPVDAFGERETYHTAHGLYKFRLWLNSFGADTDACNA